MGVRRGKEGVKKREEDVLSYLGQRGLAPGR